MESTLSQVLAEIEPTAEAPAAQARKRLSGRSGLGVLEAVAVRIAAARHVAIPPVDRKMLVVCAADHGVAADSSTRAVNAVAAGSAEVNVLARATKARVAVVDCGLREPDSLAAGVMSLPVAQGSGSDPAMTRAEAGIALETGIALALSFAGDGLDLLAVGQAATHGAASVAAATVRALLDDGGRDPLDALARHGGFDLGVAAGLCLAAAVIRVPIVLDGAGAPAAALVAARMAPAATGYMLAGHAGVDEAARAALNALDLRPILHLGMTAGDGATAAAALPIVDAAARLLREPATQRHLHVVEDDQTR